MIIILFASNDFARNTFNQWRRNYTQAYIFIRTRVQYQEVLSEKLTIINPI